MADEIVTVEQLKKWVRDNFQRFEAPARAYFEISDEKRIFLTLIAYGTEMDTVRAVHNLLKVFVVEDGTTPIFIRRDFDYEPIPEGKLTARLCFWDHAMNAKLGATLIVKKEGFLA